MASIIWLIVSLALILIGANALTDGSSAIAKRMGISDLIIGLTVVAFGTSTPELVISIVAAADGNPSIAVGNIVGSNILNILLIIGLTALVRPIFIKKSIMTNEIPMLILSSVILLVLGYSAALDGIATPTVTRVNGIFLLIFFLLFMRYTFASAKSAPQSGEKDPAEADGQRLGKFSTLKSVAFVIGGLAALIWGGDKFVDSASTLARHIGMSEATIGLTIVAIGTSLPELATSIVAAVKGQSALAVGNVIGSNIFNVLLILGTASVVAPLPFAGVSLVDLWTLVGASVLFLVFGWFFRTRCITRAEGAVMLACYLAYTAWLLIK
ncbi:MAG: calcium/sodium antiporter [Muribaculaceae bacterium]|nr:calcium/sodium antiporter [Muribaculaceae bacterium]